MALATDRPAASRRSPEPVILVVAAVGFVVLAGHVHGAPAADAVHDVGPHELVEGGAMAACMMLPLCARSAALTGDRALPHRRRRAIVEHVVGFGATWLVVGAALTLAAAAAAARLAPLLLFAALAAVAATWQRSFARERRVRRCGRLPLTAATGWRADVGTVRAASWYGARCIAPCGAAMAAMAAAPHPLLMGTVAGAALAEWAPGPNPRAAIRRVGPAVAYGAVAVIALGALAVGAWWS